MDDEVPALVVVLDLRRREPRLAGEGHGSACDVARAVPFINLIIINIIAWMAGPGQAFDPRAAGE